MTTDLSRSLFDLVCEQFALPLSCDHGPDHWARAEKVGLELAQGTAADTEIISLFALLHDSKRISDVLDPEHGERAAEYVEQLALSGLIKLDKDRLETLIFACRHHNNRSIKSDNLTVNICWDSDRIDLSRFDYNLG